MLSNITVDGRASVQTILLGQPQFRPILASPDLEQLRQRVLASYHLGPLTEGETRAYIEHRLKTVGWNDDPHWEEAAFVPVYRQTGGIPRRINTLCSRVLLFGALEETHTITGDDGRANRRRAGPGPGCWAGHRAAVASRGRMTGAPPPGRAAAPDGSTGTGRRPAGAGVSAGCWTCWDPAAETRYERPARICNAMTVDVEDYFQVQAFAHCIRRADWDAIRRAGRGQHRPHPGAVRRGRGARRRSSPWAGSRSAIRRMVRRIVAAGHELASHGWDHTRADCAGSGGVPRRRAATPAVLEDIGGVPVTGYRAATFSIGARQSWAFTVLAEEGYRYSSSVNPIRHDLYGMPDAPRMPFPAGRTGAAGNPDDHGAPRRPQLAVLRRRLFPAAARRRLARAGAGEPERRQAGHLLFPSVGDRSRTSRASPDCGWKSRLRHYTNLVAHGGEAGPAAARLRLGPHGPGVRRPARRSARTQPATQPRRGLTRRDLASMPLRVRHWMTPAAGLGCLCRGEPGGTFFHRAAWAQGDRDRLRPPHALHLRRTGRCDHRRAAAGAGADVAVRQ